MSSQVGISSSFPLLKAQALTAFLIGSIWHGSSTSRYSQPSMLTSLILLAWAFPFTETYWTNGPNWALDSWLDNKNLVFTLFFFVVFLYKHELREVQHAGCLFWHSINYVCNKRLPTNLGLTNLKAIFDNWHS